MQSRAEAMKSHSPKLVLSSFALLATLLACSGERSAGGTAETENSVLARTFLVDSILPDWNHPAHQPTVATLRLDSQDLDFGRIDPSGRDVDLRGRDGNSLPFEIKLWDPVLKHARLLIRIDTGLSSPGSRIFLWRGLSLLDRSNPAMVWRNLSDSLRMATTSVLVDDFENGTNRTLLPDSSAWFIGGDAGTGIVTAGGARSGRALRLVSTSSSSAAESLAAALLAQTPRSFRTVDSIVLWARVIGDAKISLEYATAGTQRVAWTSLPRDSAWRRIRIVPSSFDTGASTRATWSQVRDSVTHLSFWMFGSGELWIDEPRIFGIDRDDVK
jgi:hypothetical protein